MATESRGFHAGALTQSDYKYKLIAHPSLRCYPAPPQYLRGIF